MSISVPQGFSVSIPVVITDGLTPSANDTTALTDLVSSAPNSVRIVYLDPTPGVANPARSIRVDALGGTGGNISARFTSPLDGAIRNLATLVTVTAPPNNGTATFGTPGAPFLTPAA